MAMLRGDTRLQNLDTVQRLLDRHRVLDALTRRSEGPRRELVENLQRRQNLAELQRHLRNLHPADIAHVLEALTPDDRRTVWDQLGPDVAADVFIELSDSVSSSLTNEMSSERQVDMLTKLDPEDLAYVSDRIAPDVLDQVSHVLEATDRTVFDESIRYPDGSVGRVMVRDSVQIRDNATVADALAELRARGGLPDQTDHLYVVDARHVLVGAVPLHALLVVTPETPLAAVLRDDVPWFRAAEDVGEVAKAFERYDLVSAPVIDDRGKLVGRLTVETVMDLLREQADLRALRSAGLSGDEDLFAPLWASARNRWPWLGINLLTAFVVSRVIGQFEAAIQQLAALAALMPIVASIGGNTGNQTLTLVIRGLAVDQLPSSGVVPLLRKELIVSLVNGCVWGVIVGGFAVAMYFDARLGMVMSAAVALNLAVAAAAGVLVPVALRAMGRDPALGSSVLVTFVTDAMGFFLFLSLAAVFL